MSKFTYQPINEDKLETYEWNSTWWEQAPNKELPRVLYIGDSISEETSRTATAVADSKILFDNFASSKGVDNPYFADSLELFACQQGYRSLVVFNNGLHGYHLDDETEYAVHYEKMLLTLKEMFPETPIAVLLTTFVKNEKENSRVEKRNLQASKLAEKYDLPIIDFYNVSKANQDLYFCDGVHFSKEGYKKLAEYLVNAVKSIVKDI